MPDWISINNVNIVLKSVGHKNLMKFELIIDAKVYTEIEGNVSSKSIDSTLLQSLPYYLFTLNTNSEYKKQNLLNEHMEVLACK